MCNVCAQNVCTELTYIVFLAFFALDRLDFDTIFQIMFLAYTARTSHPTVRYI